MWPQERPCIDSRSPTEVLAASIERVNYHHPINGLCLLRIKARDHHHLVTMLGHAAEIIAAEWLTLSGTCARTTAEGIETSLGSGMTGEISPRGLLDSAQAILAAKRLRIQLCAPTGRKPMAKVQVPCPMAREGWDEVDQLMGSSPRPR